MRKLIIASVVAVGAAISFAAPSNAGSLTLSFGGYSGGDVQYVDHYYGHKKQYHKKHYYKKSYYKPHCIFKKIKRYDSYGNLYYKTVKVCK